MFTNNNRKYKRSSVITHYGMANMPKGRTNVGKRPFETPGAVPTGDGTQLNQPVAGDGSMGYPQTRGTPTTNPNARPSNKGKAKTASLPKAKLKRSLGGRGASKPKVQQKLTEKESKELVYYPRGGRPKIQVEFELTSRDQVPEGQIFYDGGERITTHSIPMGKLSNIRTLKQEPDESEGSATTLGQVRTLIQIVKPHFFNQFGELDPDLTGINDSELDDTHTAVYRQLYKQMRIIYQQVKSINTTFNADFTLTNTYTYFYDTFSLFAELVCLLQGAAYHLNDATGCDNIVLSAIGNTLNKDTFHILRNSMARTLRFSYLPDFCIDEAYEMYQTYRVGEGTTSGSLRFVTPHMGALIDGLGDATHQSDVENAIDDYTSHINSLIKMVKNGRSNSDAGVESNYAPPNRHWYNTVGTSTTSNNVRYAKNVFPDGSGALSSSKRQSIESFLYDISKNCKISMLSTIRRGNSQSLQSLEWSDMWNNTPYLTNTANSSFPARITGGGGETTQQSPDLIKNTIYCSETRADDITFKQVQFMLQRFTGYNPFLWYLHTNTDVTSSRYYLVQTNSNPALTTENDILCEMRSGITIFNSINKHPFIQDNYVTKVFEYYDDEFKLRSFNNPDGMSEGQWYLTLGDLRDKQYNHGIDLLM